MSPIKVQWLEYEEIHNKAEEFLNTHHPERTLPIPIHDIVDLQLGIHVVPCLGLQREVGTVGFISSDFSTITVDENIHDYVEVRFRFTLAHEIGHAILHKEIYEAFSFSSPQEWKEFQKTVDSTERGKFEWQTDCFAGLILVPREELNSSINEAIKAIDANGISLTENWDYAWDIIAENLGRKFNVSSGTIHYRFRYDKIKDRYK